MVDVAVREAGLEPHPTDWPVVEIGALRPFITSGSRGWAAYYAESGSPFLRITNLSRNSILPDLASLRFVRLPADAREGTRTELQVGDVLISITADIGVVGYVSDAIPQPAYINQHIALVRVDPREADGRFLAYYLASERAQRTIRATTDIGAKAGMSLGTVGRLKVALPPIAEQRAIAAALGDADAYLSALEAMLEKKRGIRAAAAQALLTGRIRLPGFGTGWVRRRLDEVATLDPENLGASTPGHQAIRYIALDDVSQGRLLGHRRLPFRDAPSRARRRLRRGDVLLATVRPNLQSHLWFREAGDDWIASTGFAVIRAKAGQCDPAFVYYQLFSSDIVRQIDGLIAGSNYPAINSNDVARLSAQFPSLPEQRAIAEALTATDEEVSGWELLVDKARAVKVAMAQELLSGRTRLA
ncbi:MAG TPA: restriction endonuclease subunit S [Candidatus Limnocylindrales bacterium]